MNCLFHRMYGSKKKKVLGFLRKMKIVIRKIKTKKLSYKEFLEKTGTNEICPICEYPYYDHVGTGLEYFCRDSPSNQKSYHTEV